MHRNCNMEDETSIQNEQDVLDTRPLYQDNYEKSGSKVKKIIFFAIVFLMVAITVIIAFSRGIVRHVSYGLLGFSIICISLVELALAWLLRVGQMDAEKQWFIYFVGVCIVIESIFTDVLLFD